MPQRCHKNRLITIDFAKFELKKQGAAKDSREPVKAEPCLPDGSTPGGVGLTAGCYYWVHLLLLNSRERLNLLITTYKLQKKGRASDSASRFSSIPDC